MVNIKAILCDALIITSSYMPKIGSIRGNIALSESLRKGFRSNPQHIEMPASLLSNQSFEACLG
jgi:hypothetical protein